MSRPTLVEPNLCLGCARLSREAATGDHRRVCEAFPDGVPAAVWTLQDDHRLAVTGDRGLRFVPGPLGDYAIAVADDAPPRPFLFDEEVPAGVVHVDTAGTVMTATWDGDSDGLAVFEVGGDGVRVTDLRWGHDAPASPGLLLAEALRLVGVERPASLSRVDLRADEPGAAALAAGVDPSVSVWGVVLARAADGLALGPYEIRWDVEDRGLRCVSLKAGGESR